MVRGILLVGLASAAGYAMLALPPVFLETWERARAIGPVAAWAYLVIAALGASLLAGAIGWTAWRLWSNSRRKAYRRQRDRRAASEMTADEVRGAIDEQLDDALDAARRAAANPARDRFDPATASHDEQARIHEQVRRSVEDLREKLTARTLEVVAFGTVSSGKSSLLNTLLGESRFVTAARAGSTLQRHAIAWRDADRVTLVDTPGLGEVKDRDHQAIARDAARQADLVLLVVDGPIRETEHAVLVALREMEKRVIVCLNKADWYAPSDRASLHEQVTEQVAAYVEPADVVTVQASPVERERVRVAADGTESTESYVQPAEVDALVSRMLACLRRDGSDLLLANVLLQSRRLAVETRGRLADHLDRQAETVIQKYMWRAGASAALVPIPVADLAVAMGLSTKLVVELAGVYGQPVDLETVGRMIERLPAAIGPLAGAHLGTPVVASVVASAAKQVPGVGTIAGGMLQGVTQVVVTRWIGRTFARYFRQELHAPAGSLSDLARQTWDEVTSPAAVADLVKQGVKRWGAGSSAGSSAKKALGSAR